PAREALPDRLTQARADLAATTALAARVEALTLQAEAATDRAAAATALPAAVAEVAACESAVRDRRDAAADARERVQDLTARRLAGIAAELAGRLVDGEPCVVCGSADHPAPAAEGPAPVTEEEQQAADVTYEAAQEALLAANDAAGAAQHRLDAVRERAAGLTAEEATQRLHELQQQRHEADAAAARLPAESEQVAALEQETTRLADEAARLDTELAALQQRRDNAQGLLHELTAEIAGVVGEDAADDLPGLVRRLGAVVDRLGAARAALVAHEQAAEHATDLAGQCADTAAEHGFAGADEVRAAVLDADELARLQRGVADRAELATAARSTLADPEILAIGDVVAPDLPAQQALAEAAEHAAAEASRRYHLLDQRVTALDGLRQRLATALEEWAPLRTEYLRAESMSRLVRGQGTDNHLQMRLSAYVLATRLDQVLDAANERLSHMRDQRYLLQRTGRASRKGAQAGLGLEVVDQWTGDVREPSTLSGGETFVVSLSLALGLADVVTQEAGGTEIETLFVDEGFGTLDADTLDDVMDRLDGLRAGGRTVGVVSHVTELRTRIPAQLHVHKSPRGSTIRAETLVG
ncbi:MAG: SbcC/MukB-like Walker B domain-containing protein, partial [Nocardioides sp.]